MPQDVVGRPIKIEGMAYAPTNEQGVVYLFGRLAPRLGFHIENIQTRFPDCVARRLRGKGYESCRIEFEYRASEYGRHNHSPNGADIVVCWDNDWEHRSKKYQHLEIIDLKHYVGALPRVFSVACDELKRGKIVDKSDQLQWGLPLNAQVDDLVIMYRTRPASEIRDLWRVIGPFVTNPKWGPETYLELVVRLATPLTFADLKNDRSTRNLGIVRKRFIGKSDITNDWPLLYDKIITLNPQVKSTLCRYQFD